MTSLHTLLHPWIFGDTTNMASDRLEQLYAAYNGFLVVIIPIALYVCWLIVKKVWLMIRKTRVKNYIQTFSTNDYFWNEKRMIEKAKEMFISVQKAWTRNEFVPLAPQLTDKLKMEWQEIWLRMRRRKYMFACSVIDIKRITIIGVIDHFDNHQDRFKVEITGYVRRYLRDNRQKMLTENSTTGLQKVTDIYSFIRYDDQWLLDGVHYSANFTDMVLAKTRNYHSL